MLENNDKSDFITYPKTFESYRWYKPIFVFIIAFILYVIFSVILDIVFGGVFGEQLIESIASGGYETMNTPLGEIYTDFGVILMIPALYIASKIVRDRPFSSYASSRGGWNYKLYFKAFIIPFIMIVIYFAISILIEGADPDGVYHFSVPYLILIIIFIPLQCIAEEFAFRGFFMQTFGSWFTIPVVAIIFQSIIFTLGHGYNTFGLVEIFVSGCIFGFLAWKTNGIEVSSAMHTANNFTISLFTMLGLSAVSSTIEAMDVVTSVIFDVALCIVLYYIGMKTDWFGEIPQNS